jgi:hypothetical protein
MASQWTPPPNGTPCWINIYAKDVQRAKQFYSTVFNWNFRNESTHEGVSRPADQIVKFHFPGIGTGGGITKLEENEFISTKGKGGATLFLYVDDLETYIHKITAAGGRKLSDPEPESTYGILQYFEDTEGNYVGLYTWMATSPAADDEAGK